jgi:MFS transporter, DHA2 family, multidrug resistance protein
LPALKSPARNGGPNSNPALGALQLFQNDVIVQSRLLSYVDVYFGLAALASIAAVLVVVKKLKYDPSSLHFHWP